MTFAEYVRLTRYDRKLSLQEVEDRSLYGISRGYVNQIENGQVEPGTISLDKLKSLANGLGVGFDELLAEAEDRKLFDSRTRLEILTEAFGGSDLPEDEMLEIERIVEILVMEKRRKLGKLRKKADASVFSYLESSE